MSGTKRTAALLLAFSFLLFLAACGDGAAEDRSGSDTDGRSQIGQSSEPAGPSQASEPQSEPIAEEEPTVPKLEIMVGEAAFSATLYDNAAAGSLLELLPMTLEMSELGGNEKYHYLDGSLPTDPSTPAGIHAGDIMLYGDSCLVLFYKSFSTSYSYTALGRLDDPEGFSAAVGSGDIEVTFRKG